MVDYDRELIGKVFESGAPVRVSAEMIAAFCRSIGETNPIYTDADAAREGPFGEIVAPPGLAGSFRGAEAILEHLPRGRRRLAAGIDIEFVEPIRAGDSISISSQIKEIYEKTGRTGAMTFMVFRAALRNQKDAIVANVDYRFVYRD